MVRLTSATLQQSARQKPNRFTVIFQEMKTSCPSQITAYASCVLKEEGTGNVMKGSCEKEFALVKDCFRQVRLQKTAAPL